jgi:hypothetical protein
VYEPRSHRRQGPGHSTGGPPGDHYTQQELQYSRQEGERMPLLAAAGSGLASTTSKAHVPVTHQAPAVEFAQVHGPGGQAQHASLQSSMSTSQPLATAFINLPAATAASAPGAALVQGAGQQGALANVAGITKVPLGASPAPAAKKRTVVAEDDEDKVGGCSTMGTTQDTVAR